MRRIRSVIKMDKHTPYSKIYFQMNPPNFVLNAVRVANFQVQWKKSPMSCSVKVYASQPLLRNERQFDKLKSHANTIDCKLLGRIKFPTEKWLIIVLEIGVWLKVTRACSLNWSRTLVNWMNAFCFLGWRSACNWGYVLLFGFSIAGCEGVQVEELWSLDAEFFKNLE